MKIHLIKLIRYIIIFVSIFTIILACTENPLDKMIVHIDRMISIIENNKQDLKLAQIKINTYINANKEEIKALAKDIDTKYEDGSQDLKVVYEKLDPLLVRIRNLASENPQLFNDMKEIELFELLKLKPFLMFCNPFERFIDQIDDITGKPGLNLSLTGNDIQKVTDATRDRQFIIQLPNNFNEPEQNQYEGFQHSARPFAEYESEIGIEGMASLLEEEMKRLNLARKEILPEQIENTVKEINKHLDNIINILKNYENDRPKTVSMLEDYIENNNKEIKKLILNWQTIIQQTEFYTIRDEKLLSELNDTQNKIKSFIDRNMHIFSDPDILSLLLEFNF